MAAEMPPHMPKQWPAPAKPMPAAATNSELIILAQVLGVMILIGQYSPALFVEIIVLAAANGP